MTCRLPTWKITLLKAKRDKLISQIAILETSIDSALGNAEISNYEMESGEGKQKVGRRNVNELLRARDELESELDRVYNRLCCRGVVNLGLRRYQYSNNHY